MQVGNSNLDNPPSLSINILLSLLPQRDIPKINISHRKLHTTTGHISSRSRQFVSFSKPLSDSLSMHRLLQSTRSIDGHFVQHLIEKLQGAMQVHFHPARRVLYRLPRVVRTPALDETQPQNAEPTQVVYTDSSGRRYIWRRSRRFK